MGYAKERGKLEKVLTQLVGINIYNEKNLLILDDSHDKFSHTVRILKNKEPEAFSTFYTEDLQAVKKEKKAVREVEALAVEERQNSFNTYKESIQRAVENTIKATLEIA
jgi:hypothetical protein